MVAIVRKNLEKFLTPHERRGLMMVLEKSKKDSKHIKFRFQRVRGKGERYEQHENHLVTTK